MKPHAQRAVLALLVLVMIAVWGRAVISKPSSATNAESAPAGEVEAAPAAAGDQPEAWTSLLSAPSAQRAAQLARADELTWGRDPFRSGGSLGATGGFALSGILWDANAPIAIINGQMLRAGDTVDGYRITEIGRDRVSLTDGEQAVQLLIAP